MADYVAGIANVPVDDLALLLAADLEWRWRSVPPSYPFLPIRRLEPAPLATNAPAIVEDYLAAFPQLRSSSIAVTTLVESEFIVRSRWHTPPLVHAFADRFISLLPDLNSRLVDALDDIAAIKIRVLNTPKCSDSIAVRSGVVLGRSTEATQVPPYYETATNRLFVAGIEDKTTSRNHVKIERISYDQVKLHNVSHSVGLSAGTLHLSPQEQLDVFLPLSLNWSNLHLALELKSGSYAL